MHKNSHKAAQFVVTSTRRDGGKDEHGVSLLDSMTFVFSPDTTLGQVFEKIWERSYGGVLAPEAVSIQPDKNSIPSEGVAHKATIDKDGMPF